MLFLGSFIQTVDTGLKSCEWTSVVELSNPLLQPLKHRLLRGGGTLGMYSGMFYYTLKLGQAENSASATELMLYEINLIGNKSDINLLYKPYYFKTWTITINLSVLRHYFLAVQ